MRSPKRGNPFRKREKNAPLCSGDRINFTRRRSSSATFFRPLARGLTGASVTGRLQSARQSLPRNQIVTRKKRRRSMNKSRGDDRFLRDRELSGALSSPLLQQRPAHGGSHLERLNEAAFTASHPVASSPLSYSLWSSSFSSSSYSLLSSLNLLFYYSISTNGISCLISYSQFSPFHFK